MEKDDIEELLNNAMDLMADFRDDEAEEELNALIKKLKSEMNATSADADRYYFWGRALSLLEEPEQALLRFEKSLQLVPEHEGALWETVTLLLYELERPEGAKSILEAQLIPLRPGYALYDEALSNADTFIRLKSSKPAAKGGKEDEDLDSELPEDEEDGEENEMPM